MVIVGMVVHAKDVVVAAVCFVLLCFVLFVCLFVLVGLFVVSLFFFGSVWFVIFFAGCCCDFFCFVTSRVVQRGLQQPSLSP